MSDGLERGRVKGASFLLPTLNLLLPSVFHLDKRATVVSFFSFLTPSKHSPENRSAPCCFIGLVSIFRYTTVGFVSSSCRKLLQ